MSSGIDLFARFKTQVDEDYDIYNDAVRGSILMSQAYRQAVKRYLRENAESKRNLFELRYLNVRGEVKTPTNGVLAFSSMDNMPNQFYLVKAKYTVGGNVYYNFATEDPLRKESSLVDPDERYPEYELVGDSIYFYPDTAEEVTLNYYKNPDDIDVESATDLDIDSNLEDYIIQEACQIASQEARDGTQMQMSQINQQKT